MIDALTGIGSVGAGAGVGALNGARAAAAAAASPQLDFSSVLASVAGDAVGTMKASETTAIAGIQGKASIQQVVESIMAAEQTLQTAIAVRDKVVTAYQEISRMAI